MHHAPRRFLALLLLLIITFGSNTALAAQQAPLPPPPFASTRPDNSNWSDDAVCYEIFVRSFADSDGDGIGDFQGLTDRLDYVSDGDPATQTDLGATCIWLMPIMEAASYHGYDVTDYYSVEQDYGTLDDFRAFLDAAHARGIRVILDLVLNHTSSQHPWFQEALRDPASAYREWYIFEPEDPAYPGPWGAEAWHTSPVSDEYYYGVFWEGMPDLNYRNPAVTAEARRISAFWLNEMGADGFRLDAIKHLIEEGRVQENTPATHQWLREYRAWLDRNAPDAVTIGEIFGASTFLLNEYYPDQLNLYFHFEIGQQIVSAANYGTAGGLMTITAETIEELPDQRWAPFLSNHDQPRTMTTLGGDVQEAKLAATALLTMPGLPFVYYGEEIGMTGTKPDERLRTPMQWDATPGGGFTTGTPWEPLQDDAGTVTVAAQEDNRASLLNHYRRLIHLHTTHPALSHGSFVPLETISGSVAAYLRQADGETILVILNTGKAVAKAVTLSANGSFPPGDLILTPLLTHGGPLSVTVAIDGQITLPPF
ncbi:MAG TPA: alpha-amylase family glycosyl hydrolase, partial [Thermomicrobiales bacterium]|nr:alpha-amylase family glycosyl hydrolase [Thermomicrobiales bacterium]